MRKLFVIGDSISLYYHEHLKCLLNEVLDYSRKGNEEEVNNALNVPNNPFGANAGDSFQVLKYVESLKERNISLDILAFNCGLHDIRRDRENNSLQIFPEEYRENLKQIVTFCKQISNIVYWISTTHVNNEVHNLRKGGYLRYNEDVVLYNEIAREIMEKENIPIIDLYSFTKSIESDNMYKDHVHFIDEVSKRQAEFIVSNIKEIEK